jgi:hypothetical protein
VMEERGRARWLSGEEEEDGGGEEPRR